MSNLPSIGVRAFDHVTLICADLAASRHFYVNVLGMAEVARPDFGFPGLWFQSGGVQIHATQASDAAGRAGWDDRGAHKISRSHHIAFAVSNMEAALECVRLHNIPIASPLQTRPDGFRQIYLYDPDRHVVEIVAGPAT